MRAEMSATEEAHAREKEGMEAVLARERLEAREKEEEAAEAMVDARREFESEVAEVKRESEARLEEGRALAASELEKARGETAEEARGRAEESRLKVRSVLLRVCVFMTGHAVCSLSVPAGVARTRLTYPSWREFLRRFSPKRRKARAKKRVIA